MQKVINGYERILALGPRGGTKDIKGTMTQSDIRCKADTYTVQLEIDIRMLRYAGHVARMPEDRWEHKLLFGKVKPSKQNVKASGKDSWWERLRILIKEIMNGTEGQWYEIAQDKIRWRTMLDQWKKRRIQEERTDTHATRQEKYNRIAEHFNSAWVIEIYGKEKRV